MNSLKITTTLLFLLSLSLVKQSYSQWTNTTDPQQVFIASLGEPQVPGFDVSVADNGDIFLLSLYFKTLYLHKFNKDGYNQWSIIITDNIKAYIYLAYEYSGAGCAMVADMQGGSIATWIDHRNSDIQPYSYINYKNNAIRFHKFLKERENVGCNEGVLIGV